MFEDVKKRRTKSFQLHHFPEKEVKAEIPDGTYEKCPSCEATIHVEDMKKNLWVCPKCDYHFRMDNKNRASVIFDSFSPFDVKIKTKDPLSFPGYMDKMNQLIAKQGIYDTVVCAEACIGEYDVIGVIMDPFFLMGSMGSVTGEKITRAFERAKRLKRPVVMFSASGGARMQEGMISLMQMAKTSGAVSRFSESGGLFINVLTDPTTGGVMASFAMLADIILAEPNALVGFAGPRVIEQTMRQKLAPNFQRSEFVLEKGFIDRVIHRNELKKSLETLLKLHVKREEI